MSITQAINNSARQTQAERNMRRHRLYEIRRDLGEFLQQQRAKSGLTMRAAADKMNTTRGSIDGIEKGKFFPNPKIARLMEEVYSTTTKNVHSTKSSA